MLRDHTGVIIVAKAWVYKRGRSTFVVFWRDASAKLRSKTFKHRHEAETFCHNKVTELQHAGPGNSPIRSTWADACEAYLEYVRDIRGKQPETVRQYQNTLASFCRLMGPIRPASMSGDLIEQYIGRRRQENTAAGTINKDLRHLKAFTRWAVWKSYMPNSVLLIRWINYRQTTTKRKPRTLSVQEFSDLLRAAKDLYGMPWVLRILLAVTTGLRQQDIENLTAADVSTEGATMRALNRKAHKFDGSRPMNRVVVGLLARYIAKLPDQQGRLWSDKYHASKFERIKAKANLPDVKYHSLRASCASFVMQAGFSTGVAQDLLEHSTPMLTQEIYADLSPVYRSAVDAIPVEEALKGLDLEL